MDMNKTAYQTPVTAAEWFAGGHRIPYDPGSARVLTEEEAAATQGALRVFEHVSGPERDADAIWLTMLPGFPYRPSPAELAELRAAITRRDGAMFLHNAAGFVGEHRRHAQRWDLAAIARGHREQVKSVLATQGVTP